jgi:hypothetical protein
MLNQRLPSEDLKSMLPGNASKVLPGYPLPFYPLPFYKGTDGTPLG